MKKIEELIDEYVGYVHMEEYLDRSPQALFRRAAAVRRIRFRFSHGARGLCIVTMVMMALVYVLYRTSGYTAKQVWGITSLWYWRFSCSLY